MCSHHNTSQQTRRHEEEKPGFNLLISNTEGEKYHQRFPMPDDAGEERSASPSQEEIMLLSHVGVKMLAALRDRIVDQMNEQLDDLTRQFLCSLGMKHRSPF